MDNIILFTNLYSNQISNNKTLNVNKLEIIEEFIRHFLSKKKLPDMSVIRQNIYHYFDNDINTNINTNLAQIFIL